MIFLRRDVGFDADCDVLRRFVRELVPGAF